MTRRRTIYESYVKPSDWELRAARDAGQTIDGFRRRVAAEHAIVAEGEAESDEDADR